MRKKTTTITKLKTGLKSFVEKFNLHEKMARDISAQSEKLDNLQEEIELAEKQFEDQKTY